MTERFTMHKGRAAVYREYSPPATDPAGGRGPAEAVPKAALSDRELDTERKEDGTLEAPGPHSVLGVLSLFERIVRGVGVAADAPRSTRWIYQLITGRTRRSS